MILVKATLWLTCFALIGCGAWFGRSVPFAEQWPMFEALRTTASIIFAVVGAWMAIIYPERLKLSFNQPSTKSATGPTGWGQLFGPVVNSTGILTAILIIGVLAPILKAHPPNLPMVFMRGVSYGILTTLTLWQLWTVLLTLVPASTIKTYLDAEDAQHASKAAFLQGTSKPPT